MITNIILHPNQQAQIKEIDLHLLRSQATTEFPYPLAVSFQNYLSAVKKDDKTLALVIFANDVTTTVFQFLSLILASEYIESSAPRTLRMYQAIENMTYRPGPGKWLGFMREFYNYQRQVPDELGKFPQMLDFIEKHEINKKSALLKVEENNGTSPSKKLGLLELIVNLRNNFAHSKGYDEGTLINIFGSVEQIVDLLCLELSFLKDYQLVLQPENQDDIILRGVSLPDQIKNIPTGQTLFIARENRHTRLFPLMINDQPGRTKLQDIFLMESIDNKKVFFAANRVSAEKRTDKDELATQAVSALKSIYIEPEILAAEQLSWDQFRNKIIEHSSHTLSEYVLNGKYNEHVYVLPEPMSDLMQSFYGSGKNVLFLHDEQGGGKSAFCAYMVDEYIKHNDPNQAVFLLDARLLDELGDNALLFDSFISRKLGLGGNLEDFFNRCNKKNEGVEITIIVDNLNDYFSRGIDQAHLIDRLFDLLYRWKVYPFIRFLAVARYEYFKSSIEKYHQAFNDKRIASLTYTYVDADGNTRFITPLTPLSKEELKQIWTNYSNHYTGYSPMTSWAQLNPNIKEHCNKPLIMLFLLSHYDNRNIPEKLSMDEIKKQYINGVLDEKPLRDTLFGLVKEMNRQKKPYLLTEDLDDKQMRKIADSGKDPNTMLPYNVEYNMLVDMQLVREEKVIKGELLGKKISVNNEMTLDLINEKFRNHERKISLRGNIHMILTFFCINILLLIFILFLMQKAINSTQLQNAKGFNQLPIFETLNGNVAVILSEIIEKNYVSQAGISNLLYLGIIVIIMFFLFGSASVMFFNSNEKGNKAYEKLFSFFLIFHFKELENKITKQFFRFFTLSLGLFFIVMLVYILLPEHFNIEVSLSILIIFFLLLISIMLLYVGRLYYRTLKNNADFIRFTILSHYKSIKKLGLKLAAVLIMLLLILYYSSYIFNYSTYIINQHYSEKLFQDVEFLRQSISEDDLNELTNFFSNSYSTNYTSNLEIIFFSIHSVLENGKIDILDLWPKLEEEGIIQNNNVYFKELNNSLRSIAVNYWHLILLLGIAAIGGGFFAVKVPIRLAQRELQHTKDNIII